MIDMILGLTLQHGIINCNHPIPFDTDNQNFTENFYNKYIFYFLKKVLFLSVTNILCKLWCEDQNLEIKFSRKDLILEDGGI